VAGHRPIGAALIFAGAGSMALAGLVLLISSPSKARAALIQLTAPLVGVVCLAIALVS
jgi:putative membrane protein